MKNKICILLFLLGINTLNAQQQQPITEKSKAIILLQNGDTTEVNAWASLASLETRFDSAVMYAKKGLLLAQKIKYKKGEADCFLEYALANYGHTFNFIQVVKYTLSALGIYQEIKNTTGIASAHLILQGNYRQIFDYRNALEHGLLGEQIAETNNVKGVFVFPGHRLAPLFLAEIGQTYLLLNKLDSAYLYTQKSIDQNELFNGAKWGFPIYLLGTIQAMQGKYEVALKNYNLAIELSIKNGFFHDTLQVLGGMSTLYKLKKQQDSAIYFAKIITQSNNPELDLKTLLEALSNLSEAYKVKGDKDSTLKYMELFHALKDSIFSKDKDREIQNLTFNERLKQQDILSAQAKYKSKVQSFILFAGLFIMLLIAGILWRNNRHRKSAYILLQKQKRETDFQKLKVDQAFDELKSTQSQLIQSEKMASLGELTAGIAHEIQNPLNFVNNFSEVNKELLIEMKNEMDKGNIEDAKEIANDIIANEEKINHHGKRADAIVKGMLQHRRSNNGAKEPTNINALADEYLRLSYHGLRAKDKSFNATMKTDFDESIGSINIIPQDIGRVILNLITNAFYAVDEKKKAINQGLPTFERLVTLYEPTVSVSTKKVGNTIEIKVADNGNGIPQNIADKIFQPFFTTKPTGQGTGLGLSLSYDIIKANGGEIKVESKENEGAEFVIQLPFA